MLITNDDKFSRFALKSGSNGNVMVLNRLCAGYCAFTSMRKKRTCDSCCIGKLRHTRSECRRTNAVTPRLPRTCHEFVPLTPATRPVHKPCCAQAATILTSTERIYGNILGFAKCLQTSRVCDGLTATNFAPIPKQIAALTRSRSPRKFSPSRSDKRKAAASTSKTSGPGNFF